MALPVILNPGFETPVVGETAVVNPSGSDWTWSTSNAGIEGRASRGLYSGQYGFVESSGFIQQSMACDGTPFQIRFAAKYRLSASPEMLRLTMDGATVADFLPDVAWALYTTPTITPAAGSRTFRFARISGSIQFCIDSIEVLAVAPTTSPGRLLCFSPGATGLMG